MQWLRLDSKRCLEPISPQCLQFRLPLLRLTKLAAPVPEGGNVGTLTRNEDTDVWLAGMKGAEKQKINGSSYMGQVNKIMSYKHGPCAPLKACPR